MIYFDTSFLAPLVLPEATSDRIAALVAALPAGRLTVSQWGRVEFSSLIARHVRMGLLEARQGLLADARFQAMLDATFAVVTPNAADFDVAKQYLGRYESGLRAGDALHLAIAANHRAEVIYSLDRKLLEAGIALGLPVSPGLT